MHKIGLLKESKLQNALTPCKLVKDKLLVGKNLVDPNFENNPITPRVSKNFSKVKPTSSNDFTEKGSKFQAHAVDIKTLADAEEGLAHIIKDHPHATHMVYAYASWTLLLVKPRLVIQMTRSGGPAS